VGASPELRGAGTRSHGVTARLRRVAKAVLPARARAALRERHLAVWPPVGHARLGHLRRTTPISENFGYERGSPIDRHYIEGFLARHAGDIRGAALEFQDDAYLRRFGGEAVTSFDVLNVERDYPGTTIVADLAVAEELPVERFDCIVCTGVVQLVYDLHAAVSNLNRMLRPGGVALVTMPGITRIARDPGGWTDHWRLTSLSARKLFASAFGEPNVELETFGNPLSAIALLTGLAVEDLRREELDATHPDFEVVIGVRAVRGG
jgi:SAM-dependent methyltransferase